MNEAGARRDLVRYSGRMQAAGWVANHDGNLSARIGEDRIVCTPTAFSKGEIGIEDLVVVNSEGRKLAGAHRAFSELVSHLVIYGARSDARAVVHAHPPFATAFGISGRPVPHPFLPEAVVSLGPEIPTVPMSAPGQPGAKALRPFVRRCDVALVAGNGVWAWGPDIEMAYLRLELVEHLCRIAHAAAPLGGPFPLPEAIVAPLLAKRRKAGLAAPEEDTAGGGANQTPDDVVARAIERALATLPNADATLVARIAAEVAAKIG